MAVQSDTHPTIADHLAAELGELRTSMTALSNAVGIEDHGDEQSAEDWGEAYTQIGRLEDAVDKLRDKAQARLRELEAAHD